MWARSRGLSGTKEIGTRIGTITRSRGGRLRRHSSISHSSLHPIPLIPPKKLGFMPLVIPRVADYCRLYLLSGAQKFGRFLPGICPERSGRSMAKQRKKVPIFKSEDEEREFWARHDSTDYIDYKKAKRVQFPNLKPSSRAISIRLPESLIENIKVLANREDVPYQSMMKVLLAEKVTEALRSPKRKKTAA